MIQPCKNNLMEIKSLLYMLNNDQYLFKSKLLSGSSIAEHTRHILEFYICLTNGYVSRIVNYDNRERNLRLQSEIDFAVFTIDKICSNLNLMREDKELKLAGNFASSEDNIKQIITSSTRELAYCLEHSIHHQALIKIGLLEMHLGHLINENFGIAAATIRFKEKQ